MASPPTGVSESTGSPVSQEVTTPTKDCPHPGSEYIHPSEDTSAQLELHKNTDGQENKESYYNKEELEAVSEINKDELISSVTSTTAPDLLTGYVSTAENVESSLISTDRSGNRTGDTHISTTEKQEEKVVKSPTVRFSSCSKGGNSEEVEVIEFTHTEIMDFETNGNRKCLGPMKGPHIVLLTILCFPAALFISLFGAFYYGALTWYNLLTYVTEEKKIWHKIFISPVIILSFPFTVGLTALIISVFSAFVQISWSFTRWREVILDVDKGFYGWLCDKLRVPMCSPYDSVIIHEDSELEPMRT